jgi:type I restriction enzyme M protein
MDEQYQQTLNKQLWNIASNLRGSIPDTNCRDFILGLFFYKYLSDKLNFYANTLLYGEEIRFADIDDSTENKQEILDDVKNAALNKLGYFFKPSELFHVIAMRGAAGKFILDDVTNVLNHIEQSTMGVDSADDFNGLFSDLDLTSYKLGKTSDSRNKFIVKLLVQLNNIEFHLESDDVDVDVLGDAYEYLIRSFSRHGGKSSGEFYTPPMISKLLAKLLMLDNQNIKSVYDPVCGSGSLLLRVAREANNPDLKFFGQEQNPSTHNLARMNMIMHNVHYSQFDIKCGNTLEEPAHLNLRFDAVVANPPFSAYWSANPQHLHNERFSDYGKLAPKSKADFAFVQHMIHQLDDQGTMAVVLPHGVLFRGAAEGHIRQHLIKEKNYLDMVIGLPANIFFGTSIPTCILVFKKNRVSKDDIQFIDASNCFTKSNRDNYLQESHIDSIISAANSRTSIERFSRVVSLCEIEKNNFNINISRYVDASPEALYLQGLNEQLEGYETQLVDPLIIQYITTRERDLQSTYENALILSRTNIQRVFSSKNKSEIQRDSFVLVCDKKIVNAEYLELFFNSSIGNAILKNCVIKGSALSTLNLESLKNNLSAPIPPLEIQVSCVEANNRLNSLLKKLSVFQSNIIFKPNSSQELLEKLENTISFVNETNRIEGLLDLIRRGENSRTEFKESFSLNVRRYEFEKGYTLKKEDVIELSSLKTIAGFLNSHGGTLFIGVADDLSIKGLTQEVDKLFGKSTDSYLLHIKNRIKDKIGENFYPFIKLDLEVLGNKPVLVVKCTKANQPCFLGSDALFYARSPTGATDCLKGTKMWDYSHAHFNNKF